MNDGKVEFFGSSTLPHVVAPVATDAATLDALYTQYEAVMKDYQHHAEPGKWTFMGRDGYKFHLNVKPENVQEVSVLLKNHDYEHKYLSGGEAEDGKIFTVLGGSKEQTERIIREIADSPVAQLLEPPVIALRQGEVLYAPNISGRFISHRDEFNRKSPIHGIPKLEYSDKLDPIKKFAMADKQLKFVYGGYYGGGITFYQPA